MLVCYLLNVSSHSSKYYESISVLSKIVEDDKILSHWNIEYLCKSHKRLGNSKLLDGTFAEEFAGGFIGELVQTMFRRVYDP